MDTVSIQLNGRLGNHIFEVAAAYAHAKRHGLRLAIHRWRTQPRYFSAWLHRFTGAIEHPPIFREPMWTDPAFAHTSIPASARRLDGYFQSDKYFSDVSGDIRALFRLPAAVEQSIVEKWADILRDKDSACAIHVRRADYFTAEHAGKYGILTDVYYRRAMDAARAAGATRFVVISDDITWCRAQPWLSHTECQFVDEPIGEYALYLLTQMPMFIGSNSTFSWWGAYLGVPKQVWMPIHWFGPRGPQDYEDVYVKGWHRMPID